MARHLILYDGECGLCNRLNQFVLDHDRDGRFDFASLQGSVGQRTLTTFGVSAGAMDTVYVVTEYQTDHARLFDRSNAVMRIAAKLGWPWKALVIFKVFPRFLRDAGYDAMARNRHKFFSNVVCRIPDESTRRRFIDS